MRVRWLTLEPERGRQDEPVCLDELGGMAAEEFHAVAELEKGDPLERQSFELDRAGDRSGRRLFHDVRMTPAPFARRLAAKAAKTISLCRSLAIGDARGA